MELHESRANKLHYKLEFVKRWTAALSSGEIRQFLAAGDLSKTCRSMAKYMDSLTPDDGEVTFTEELVLVSVAVLQRDGYSGRNIDDLSSALIEQYKDYVYE